MQYVYESPHNDRNTRVWVFCVFGGASTLHRAGTQTRFNSRFKGGGVTKSEGRKIDAEKKVIRQSARARWRDPNTCKSGRARPRSAFAPEPCCPSRGSLRLRAPLWPRPSNTLLWPLISQAQMLRRTRNNSFRFTSSEPKQTPEPSTRPRSSCW